MAAQWIQGASDEQRDAHFRAQRWAHVVEWQIDRLHASRQAALESHQAVLKLHHYPDEARWPFMRMEAEAHFALTAARQSVRALRAFDGNDQLPAELPNAQLRDVRDALEHWDEPGGSRAALKLAKQGVDPFKHAWQQHSGVGVLGEVVSDAALRQWAIDVYAELGQWDPYDGWKP